jgi:hypothetical protein
VHDQLPHDTPPRPRPEVGSLIAELGFVDVRPLGWWRSTRLGELEVTALPFYGEQPTEGEVLHPEIRKIGNTYVVRAPGWSAAFLADSGRDHLGDVRDVALTQWSVRQSVMNDVDGLLDTAERFGCRWVVPYADGGAPWFWSIGLGPRLDGSAREDPVFDPFPERVEEAARLRAAATSTPRVLLLRPGDSVRGLPDDAEVVRTRGHAWPW